MKKLMAGVAVLITGCTQMNMLYPGCRQIDGQESVLAIRSDYKLVGTDAEGNAISANDLRDRFYRMTGYPLARPAEELEACYIATHCRFDAWQKAYDRELSIYTWRPGIVRANGSIN